MKANYLKTIFDNLLKAGVKGTTKGQRMTFDRMALARTDGGHLAGA